MNPSGGEHICFDPSFSTSCNSDADCPLTPGGIHGKCLDATTQTQMGDPTYHKCFIPFYKATDRFSCWCENKGAGCLANKDCCSNKCLGASPSQGVTGNCQ
jgi:hypothetical protein